MARDYGRFKIRTVAIAPAMFETPMSEFLPKPNRDFLLKQTPVGRFGDCDEFAHFTKAMIENDYINGSVQRIDGGQRLSYYS